MRTAEYCLIALVVGALVILAGTALASTISAAFEQTAERIAAPGR